jgi:hypothetical protein
VEFVEHFSFDVDCWITTRCKGDQAEGRRAHPCIIL